MRCERCKKKFDEEMYSGICPDCGHFNNRQAEYDVSKYFSAKFDDGGKVSGSAQAAGQHEQLHRMYDGSNMHKPGAGQHEKLHRMYDKHDMHRPAPGPLAGKQQTSSCQQGVSLGKINPYQKPSSVTPGNPYQAGKNGAYGQNRTYQAGQARADGQEKKKNFVTPVCIIIAVLAIAGTAAGCQWKKQSLEQIYYTLEFEEETAQAGELFDINERLFVVDKAEVVDTSALYGMPKGEKLVAVTVEILPAGEGSSGEKAGDVYVSDGSCYKMPLDDYTVLDILYNGDYSMKDGVLSGYSFYGYISAEGESGESYFFVDEDAKEITVSFEAGSEKEGIYVLNRRVNIPLRLEEGSDDE